MSQFSLKPHSDAAVASAPPMPSNQEGFPASGAASETTSVPPAASSSPPVAPATPAPYHYKRPVRQKGNFFGFSTLLFFVVCGFGYYKYDEYQKRPPPAPPPKPKEPLKEVSLTANPLTALKQAKETIAVAGEKHKAAYDEVASMDQSIGASTKPAPGSASLPHAGGTVPAAQKSGAPATPGQEITTVQTQASNQLTTPVAAGLPKPSPAFIKWARKVRIGGVRPGATPRVFIERTTYQKGDTVDKQLGISFENYESSTRMLSFKERSGAVMEIKYGAD